MKLYDPFGVVSPFLLRSKVLLRSTWELRLQWDDVLPDSLRARWVQFFQDLFSLAHLKYDRCLKPQDAVGNPILVILSDASDLAYGFSAYIRWKLSEGGFWCRLIMAKCRIAPLRKLSTPQMELNAAVLSKRARKVIEQELRLSFERVYHLVDSETVLHMLNKMSTRFKLYEGVRVGEIQAATGGNLSEWFWVSGKSNTADWVTRGKSPEEISPATEWWKGPVFLYQEESLWGIKEASECCVHTLVVPGEKVVVNVGQAVEVTPPLVHYQKFSSVSRLFWIIARVVMILKQKTFRGGVIKTIPLQCYEKAKLYVLLDVQKELV
jgi:hypothetical protein